MSAVANEIYRTLGGNKFRVMTGAKMMVEDLAQDPPGRHVIRCEGIAFL